MGSVDLTGQHAVAVSRHPPIWNVRFRRAAEPPAAAQSAWPGLLLGLSLLVALPARAGQTLHLFWDASPDPNVVGYNVYYGAASRHYTNVTRFGNVTEVELNGLPVAPALFFAVTAVDAAGLESAPSNELVWTPAAAQTTGAAAQPVFRVRGQGYLNPDYSMRQFTPGKIYTVTAVPRAGYVFAGWSGSFNSTDPRLSFPMQPGLVLEANFIPNPFLAWAGNYSGLFSETNGVRPDRAGCFNLTLTSRGTYSGRAQLGGARIAFSGQLQVNGQTAHTFRSPDGSPRTLFLQFPPEGDADAVLGRVTKGAEWAAELRGDRAVFSVPGNPCPFAGAYTLAVQGKTDDPRLPAGCGCGTVRVTPAGRVSFSGALGDGTRLSQSAGVSRDGRWPFFAGVYGGRGVVLSWLAFEPRPGDDLHGLIAWVKPPDPRAASYRSGFADTFEARGAAFVPPVAASESLLGVANARIVFDGPCLAKAFTNRIALGLNDKVTNLNSNRLTWSFSRSSGGFAGRVTEPVTGVPRAFRGVVLQKAGVGLGFLQCDGATARAEVSR